MTPAERVLLVEDEEAISDALTFSLQNEGFAVTAVAYGESALELSMDDFDAVVLDLNLPRISGVEVCRRIREKSIVPILMLTARTSELDRVLGLEIGADDYVSKPFSTPELIGRIRAVLRRRQMDMSGRGLELEVAGLRLDLGNQAVFVDGREVALTPSEFRLLALLASKPEHAFPRREIVEHLSRGDGGTDVRVCDVHVKNLRQKIEPTPSRPERVVTVQGVGYMLRAG